MQRWAEHACERVTRFLSTGTQTCIPPTLGIGQTSDCPTSAPLYSTCTLSCLPGWTGGSDALMCQPTGVNTAAYSSTTLTCTGQLAAYEVSGMRAMRTWECLGYSRQGATLRR